MGQLHEVLAVENELKNIAKKITEEGINTFSKKPDHFLGFHKTLKMFNDARSNEEAAAGQHRELVTTVNDKLLYVAGHIIKALDATAQKESTNQLAKADVVINGKTVLKDVPATLLLTLEKEIKVIRDIYKAIPTLQPGIEWKLDTEAGEGVYRTVRPEARAKTEKVFHFNEISPPTKEHKAQIREWNDDRPVGNYETTQVCSMISPGRKSVLLGRIEDLFQAVRKARSRANKQEIIDAHIGEKIFGYINS